MRCPKDSSEMKVIATVTTADEKQIVTNYCCMTCFKRVLQFTSNPRYAPTPKIEQHPNSVKQRKPMKDEVHWERREEEETAA